jgi:hypothetical protein
MEHLHSLQVFHLFTDDDFAFISFQVPGAGLPGLLMITLLHPHADSYFPELQLILHKVWLDMSLIMNSHNKQVPYGSKELGPRNNPGLERAITLYP